MLAAADSGACHRSSTIFLKDSLGRHPYRLGVPVMYSRHSHSHSALGVKCVGGRECGAFGAAYREV